VCCDNTNVLRFYDFVDMHAQKVKEEQEQHFKKIENDIVDAFRKADDDKDDFIDIGMIRPLIDGLARGFNKNESEKEALVEKIYNWLDNEGTGKVNFYEFKVQLMRAYIKGIKDDELAL